MRHVMPIFMALGLGLAATPLFLTPVLAVPSSINDCEKIEAADAYNLCLAAFGPVAHEHQLKAVPPGADRLRYVGRHRGRHLAYAHHRGRKRMILSVKSTGD